MLKRERHTFSEVAVLTDTILIVRAADRHIPGYIGGALRGSWLNTKRGCQWSSVSIDSWRINDIWDFELAPWIAKGNSLRYRWKYGNLI